MAANMFGLLFALAALRAALGQETKPVQKVIQLLEDLKAEVESDGKAEAGTYDAFACFCKEKTASKSDAIKTGQDTIDSLAANIEQNSALKAEKATELADRNKKQEALAKELEEVTARCEKQDAEFEAQVADLVKAISSLEKAINALEAAQSALLQREAIAQVRESVAVAEVLGLATGAHVKAVSALLQQGVDPTDPEYKFRSGGVVDTLKKMLIDFQTKKGEVEGEWNDAKTACSDLKGSIGSQMEENGGQISTLETDIDKLESDISADRESLVVAQDTLADDQLYLKDLTERCEKAAKDWDQRSAARADELKVIAEALVVLKDGKDGVKSVQELDAVNVRAFFQSRRAPIAAASATRAGVSAHVQSRAKLAKAPALFQQAQAKSLRGSRRSAASVRLAVRDSGREGRAAAMLRARGDALRSEMLTSVAAKVMEDPFVKVKALIQQLIERLLEEAKDEATKKGFCDMEIGKAKTDRDHRHSEVKKLSTELKELAVKRDEFNQTMTTLKEEIPKLYTALEDATAVREAEKKQNLETIKLAKEGAKAVKEAIETLKVYYASASRATVLAQASPVDDDTTGPGFEGAYRGKQASANGVVGLLEVIESDFLRTAKMTQQSEDEAHADFVEFDRVSREDISAKETSLQLASEDFQVTTTAITAKLEDLGSAQDLLDKALLAIEDLKPMCIDTAMSYAERQQKREDEIAALKEALCILDPNGVESECGGNA